MKRLCSLLLVLAAINGYSQGTVKYQVPPAAIADEFRTRFTEFMVNTSGEWMLLTSGNNYPSVKQLAHPTINLAGLYVNPENFASASYRKIINRVEIKNTVTSKRYSIQGLPEPLNAGDFRWNADKTKIAFTQVNSKAVDLYVIDVATKTARKINRTGLHTAIGEAFVWSGDDLYYKTIAKSASEAPAKTLVPDGPFVMESDGKTGYTLTYTSQVINSTYEEELFSFYATAQLVKNHDGKETMIGGPQLYKSFSVSPDQENILTSIIEKPFSNQLPYEAFPATVAIYHQQGRPVTPLFKLPAKKTVQQDAPRLFNWRGDQPATLYWVQPAGDINNPKPGNEVYQLSAPFTQKRLFFTTEKTLASISWSDDGMAWVKTGTWRDKTETLSLYNGETGALVFSHDQLYREPQNKLGAPVTTINRAGQEVINPIRNGRILISNFLGNKASGGLPFLANFDLATKQFEFVWKGSKRESITAVLDPASLLVVRQEGRADETAAWYLEKAGNASPSRMIFQQAKRKSVLDSVTHQMIEYKRADNIQLSGKLYLPPGYDAKKHGRLPLIIWGYPREFDSVSQYRYERSSPVDTGISIFMWESPQIIVTQGYAFFDAGMPVFPKGEQRGNDRYVEELVMNAEAAIDMLVQKGIADRDRVGVAGHSYGGAMAATLVAHSKLFKAGMAMSGGYNRTLSPFGFQDETRTFWQAKKAYEYMSPLLYADQIKTPLLIIHGDNDTQIGTPPAESDALYKAVQGNNGIVRYVSLPLEGHGYETSENILHWYWEMNNWFEKYLKDGAKKNF